MSDDIRESLSTPRARRVFSCVMADTPVYAHQTLTLVWTLLDLAHVPAGEILVHALDGSDAGVRRQLDALGVRTTSCHPFRDGAPHCNKIQQLHHPAVAEADTAILCDTDLAFAAPIDDVLPARAIRAKIVDHANPPTAIWQDIFDASGLPGSLTPVAPSFGDHTTPSVNCNGGLYLVPGGAVSALRDGWPRWAAWLLDRPALLPPPYHVHVDQVAFGLAVLESGLPVDLLSLPDNCPTHGLAGPLPDLEPRVLHYHGHIDPSGFPAPVGVPGVDRAIARVRDVIARRRRAGFDNRTFWNFRYAQAPAVGSGLGSRGAALDEKRRMLSQAVHQNDAVLDIGCGDLEVSHNLAVARYTGVDVSGEAIVIARRKRPEWTFYTGDLRDLTPRPHDVVVCLDVLIHQRTMAAYRSLLADVVRLAGRAAVVSGYNQPPWHQSDITFFHEPLTASIARLAGPDRLDILGGYRDTTAVRVDTAGAATEVLAMLRGAARYDTAAGRFLATPGDLIAIHFETFGGHTRNELAMILSFLADGDAVIDIGAHIGSFTVPLAARVGPQGLVVAVEPEAANVELLYYNIAANAVDDRVVVIETLAGDRANPHGPIRDATNSGASHFVANAGAEARLTPRAVDDIATSTLAGRRPRLIKVDVEGMELGVLRSGAATIAAARPLIYCEVVADQLARHGHAVADLAAFFDAHGYLCYRNTGERNSTHDRFTIGRLNTLAEGGAFFDCLAVPREQVPGLHSAGRLPG